MNHYEYKKFQEIMHEIPNDEYRVEKIKYEILKN